MLRGYLWAVLCVFSVTGVVSYVQSVEADGFVRIHPGWLEEHDGGSGGSLQEGRVLRLSLQPVVALEDTVLTVMLPRDIRIDPLTEPWSERFQPVLMDGEKQAIRVTLGRILPNTGLLLDFEFLAAGEESGIASFRIEAKTASGRQVHEAAGVTLGHPGVRPVRRHGAMEFPAVTIPGERP
jgi:hypothetical protein